MTVLMDAGRSGRPRRSDPIDYRQTDIEASVKHLLQPHNGLASHKQVYANTRSSDGETSLMGCIAHPLRCTRVARLLVDAGANTAESKARLTNKEGKVVVNDTVLTLTTRNIRSKKVAGRDATAGWRVPPAAVECGHSSCCLLAVAQRRPLDRPESRGRATATLTPITVMLPILKRRARRSRVLVAATFR